MPRLTLGDAKKSRLPSAIGACPDDPRFLDLLNEATNRLLNKGLWWGTVQRWRFCATDGCIALPSQIATLEGVTVCGQPLTLRDQYFEFLQNGFGIQGTQVAPGANNGSCCGGGGCGCSDDVIYRGHFCTFYDVNPAGNPKKLNVVCDRVSDVGKNVLLLGYDVNGNWVRTNQGGVVLDGELVAMAQGAGTLSNTIWSNLTDIQPPSNLDGQWWLFEYDTVLATLRMIGQYNYFDTRPHFARYFFPSIRSQPTPTNGCNQTMVEALVKLAFIPVVKDTDYLIIGCLPALKEAIQALSDSENDPDNTKANQIVTAGLAVAVQLLDEELDHYVGTGRRVAMTVVGSGIGSSCPVPILL